MGNGGTQGDASDQRGVGDNEPRVVILDMPHRPQVAVVELPPRAGAGSRFCHHGTAWRVVGARTHDRVLICQPA